MTKSQQNALNALAARNGTGIFDKYGVMIAGGDRLAFTRSTWSKLRGLGLVDIDGKRATVTEAGLAAVTDKTPREHQVASSDAE